MPHLVIVQLTPRRPVKAVLHDQAAQAIVGRAPEGRPVGELRIDQSGDLRAAQSIPGRWIRSRELVARKTTLG